MTLLYLQEKTQIIGMHPNRRLFAGSIADYASVLNAREYPEPFRNVGVWEFVGMTGSWARVLGLYEFSNGWDSLCDMIGQIMKDPSPELAATYRAVESRRSGGMDEILAPLAGCPTYEDIKREETAGALLVLDEARVAPGAEADYAGALIEQWRPVAAAHGHSLIGLYGGALTDGLVLSYWVTSLADYARLKTSGAAGRWHETARRLRIGWREELWTATPGSTFSDATVDYGDRNMLDAHA